MPDRFEDAGREYFDKLSNCYNTLLDSQHARLSKFVNKKDLPPFLGYQPNAIYIDAMKPLAEVIDTVKGIILERLLPTAQQSETEK